MRCRECDYPLWNLATRQCPECGKDFKPSDYVFIPNSVRYHCPDCKQEYYGTTETGHLHPVEFDCVRCQRHVHMDEMVLTTAAGVDENQTRRRQIPWQDQEKKSIGVSRLFSTAMMGIGTPYKLGLAIAEKAEGGRSFLFAFWMWLVHVTLMFSGFVAIVAIFMFAGPGGGGPGAGWASISFVVGGLIYVIAGVIFQFLWVAAAHGIVCISRPDHRPFATTAAAVNYSMGPLVCASVPCLGVYLVVPMGIWWMVAASCSICGAHGISKTRAAFAACTFPTILGGGAIVAYMAFIAVVMTQGFAGPAGGPFMMGNSTAGFEFASQQQALTFDAAVNGGQPTKHIISLVDNAILTTSDFVHADSDTWVDDIDFGIFTLEDWEFAGATKQNGMTNQLLNALPDDMVAYRVGDFVFCYGGLNLNTVESDIWLVVLSEMGLPGAEPTMYIPFEVLLTDGTVTTYYTKSQLDQALQTQNALRRIRGYPELPDPTCVRFDGSVVTPN